MATLIERDTSGIYLASEDESEMVDLRTRSFKKFRKGRQRRISGQIGPIHYRLDPFSDTEQYKEIDLTISLTPGENWDAAMESNGYQVRFWQSRVIAGKTVRYIAQFKRADKWLAMAPLALVWENDAGDRESISKPVAGIIPDIDNDAYTITWANCFGPGLHYRYNVRPDHFFKTVIIDAKSDLPAPTISGTGLKLTVVLGISWHSQAKAANGFADSVVPDVIPNDTDTSSIDEELLDPPVFAYKDESLRDAFWVQKPKAWDSAEARHSVPMEWRLRRRGNRVFAALSVPAIALNNPDVVYPVFVDTDISEEQVGAGADDANIDYFDPSGYDPTGNNAHVGRINTGFRQGCIGMIFRTIPIPQGVTIDSAAVTVRADTSNSSNTRTKFRAYDADNYADDLSTEVKWNAIFPGSLTTAEVEWNSTPVEGEFLPAFTIGDWFQGIDMSSVIQEITDRVGWASGNNLVIFWDDYDDRAGANGAYRTMDTYEAGASFAPKFNASYTEAASGQIIHIQRG